jgi:predicted kinase
MSEPLSEFRPTLIVVAGRPGSGKTTLANALARAIRCPAISRDEIKEGLVNSLSAADAQTDAAQRHATDVFFKTVELLLKQGITLVADAAFQHKVWAPKLQPLLAIAKTRIIVCTVDAQLARARYIQRGVADPDRERFHPDPAMHAARDGLSAPIATYDPPQLDIPTLMVNTSDGYDPTLERIVAFVRGVDN